MIRVYKIKRPLVKRSQALTPEAWRNTGKRLMKGADLMWPPLARSIIDYRKGKKSEDVDYFAPFFLLAGLAVENYVKGRLIEERIKDGRPVQDFKELFEKPAGLFYTKRQHDVWALARKTSLVLSETEENLLRRLSKFVLWGARYPVPRHADDPDFRRDTRDRDMEEIKQLIQKLRI